METNEMIELARQSGYNEACYIFEERVKELKKVLCPYADDKHAVEHVWINKQINKILHSQESPGVEKPVEGSIPSRTRETTNGVAVDDTSPTHPDTNSPRKKAVYADYPASSDVDVSMVEGKK